MGGSSYCPLDRDARIVVTSTPRFAKVLSHNYAEFSSARAKIDLKENHGPVVSRCLIQDVADAVATAVLAWRETMVGTLAFYDREGERLHTVSLGATPEYGKAKFLGQLKSEIARAKAKCPEAHYVGVGDVAKGNWDFLGRHTEVQVTDFWHAAEYLGRAAVVLYRGHPHTREEWLDDACHRLKHDEGGSEWVLKQFRRLARERP